MNEQQQHGAVVRLRQFLDSTGAPALQALKVTKEDLVEALDAMTGLLIKYDKIPDQTWAFLLKAVSDGLKGKRGDTNSRTDLG